MIRILAILVFVGLSPLLASTNAPQVVEVLEHDEIRISAPEGGNWKPGEFLCVMRAGKNIACGVARDEGDKGSIIKLDFTNEVPQVGDSIAKPKAGKTAVTPIPKSDNISLRGFYRPKNWIRSALLWDVNQWFYSAGYERLFTGHVSWGAKFELFDIFNVNTQLDGYGFLLTRSFFSLPSFSGVTAQVGTGAYFFTGRNGVIERQAVSFIVELNVGWRFQLLRCVGLGFQFGMRYITQPNFQGLSVGAYHPLRGAIGMELALRL